ncbi:MAG: ATP-binding protein [Methanofollis sp.]|uniref:AlbA family DNA-binding domain-containing protein n=1 Tax=Methanofollis sp. TaxID=2052835 RepID=UPI0026132734|nr:ATP-binding protein [Methanofollis sp.]MDD4255185.1 ATP-binding protein [Methanofollis sp.]
MSAIIGGIREAFAPFFEDPDRTKLRDILKDNLGEFNHLDYKESMIGASKLARIIIAMANSMGGTIVFGVKELEDNNYEPVGLENFEDKTHIQQKLSTFVPENLDYEILDFAYDESEYGVLKGKKFQVFLVKDTPQNIPFLPRGAGEGIQKNRIYYRGNTNSEEATYEQIQEILARRTTAITGITSKETFKNDLFQLEELYGHISRSDTVFKNIFSDCTIGNIASLCDTYYESKPNPHYPQESFDEFIAKMIARKKSIIESAVMNCDKRGP